MKHLYLTILLLIFFLKPSAQSLLSGYRVIYSNEPYVDIIPDSILWEDYLWVDSNYQKNGWVVPINKEINNKALNYKFSEFSYFVYSNVIRLNGENYDVATKVCNCYIREYSDTPPYQTKISYKLDTSNNNIILKFELKNLGITDTTYKTKGKVNFQVWFHEGGDVELRYGESQIDNKILTLKPPLWGKFKPTIGVIQMINAYESHNLMLVGPYDNPRLHYGINTPFFNLMYDSALSMFPPAGTVYRFTTWKVGVKNETELNHNEIIYPNPFSNELSIDNTENQNFSVQIFNQFGKEIGKFENQNKINTTNIPPGIYFIHVKYASGKNNIIKAIKYIK